MHKRAIAAALAAVVAAGFSMSPLTVGASSHREAPLIAEDPLADNTDLYAFTSPDATNTVTIVANYIPFEQPAGGPNFYRFGDDVNYQIHVDNVGDAQDHIVFSFQFKTSTVDPTTFLYNTGPITFNGSTYTNWNRPQTYTVTMTTLAGQNQQGNQDGDDQDSDGNGAQSVTLGSNLLTAPDIVGSKSTPNYHDLSTAAIHSLPSGVKVFAGQRDDPFFANLGGAFDLLNLTGAATGGTDYLAGLNVHSIVLQVPKSMLRGPNDGVIGLWATASRHAMTVLNGDGIKSESGPWVQVSRLGNPLVNELVIGVGQKDLFNATTPAQDGQFLSRVTSPLMAVLLNAVFGLGAPTTNRQDLVAVFLSGIAGVNQPDNLKVPGY
jgi:hypothetical protein